MEYIFLHDFVPIWECIGILSGYVNESKHDWLLRKDPSQQANHQAVCKSIYDLLHVMQASMGVYLDQQYADLRYLFEIYDEYHLSFARKICLEIDPEERDIASIFKSLYAKLENDSCFVLRECVKDSDIDAEAFATYSEERLLQQLEGLHIPDQVKWKVSRLRLHGAQTLRQLEAIMQAVYPMYLQHSKEMQEILQVYEEDIRKSYDNENMLAYFLQKNHIKMDSGEKKKIIVIPSMCMYRSLTLTDYGATENSIMYASWGLCVLMKEDKQALDVDQICTGLKLLSDKSKFEILRLLQHQRLYGAQLAKRMQLSTPTISYHVQALLNQGFIFLEKEDNRLYYQCNTEYTEAFFEEVKQMLKQPL